MKDTFALTLIHRPELAPEYAEKIGSTGEKENIAKKELRDESLDIFRLQQEIAHKNGLKTTILMTYASLFSDEAVALAKEHHAKFGDEIGLTLLGLPCKEFREKYHTKDFCIWMFSWEDKVSIVSDVFSLFYKKFGFYPESTGSYYMDAELINYIKKNYPSIKCAIATCWEEGPKAYHTTNNSWYTFLDGGPWNPWIPSKQNTHAPAANAQEDDGIVAIPHLSRDLLACFDGNGSNFGTHPQNVLRGMIYRNNEMPYLFNLIDQYRHLAKYNNGYSYNMMFVGPGWMNKKGRWEAPYELLVKSYEDGLAYYGQLKKQGQLVDMTMSEFADFYRKNKTYEEPECALWQDILYGGGKQLFWYSDPFFRTCVDLNQGGALIDLRPYVAKLVRPVGIGTEHVYDASYPYLIQSNYRAGYFTHYAGEGTLKSCKISFEGEEVDVALCRTKGHFRQEGQTRVLELDPVEIVFKQLTINLKTTIFFEPGSSAIRFKREIIGASDPSKKVEINDYVTAAFGTTEYSEDMKGISLKIDGKNTHEISYEYKCREYEEENAQKAIATIPQINTRMSVYSDGTSRCYFKEGYAFSPMFTLGVKKLIKENEAINVWLKLEKAD